MPLHGFNSGNTTNMRGVSPIRRIAKPCEPACRRIPDRVERRMAETKPPTHTAYTLKRETRVRSRYIEIGHAHVATEPGNVHHVFIDRLPVGGWTGHVFLSPVNVQPPDPQPEPERPATGGEGE